MTISLREMQMLQEVLVALTGTSTMSIQTLIGLSKRQFHDPVTRQTLENEITRLRASIEATKGLSIFLEEKLHREPKKSAIKRHLEKAEMLTEMIRTIRSDEMECEMPDLLISKTDHRTTRLRRARTSAGKPYRQESVTTSQDVVAILERKIQQLLEVHDGDRNIPLSNVPSGSGPMTFHGRNGSHTTPGYNNSASYHSRKYSTVSGRKSATVRDSEPERFFSPEGDHDQQRFHLMRALGTPTQLASSSQMHPSIGNCHPTNPGRPTNEGKYT
jgi:hypothetical protein